MTAGEPIGAAEIVARIPAAQRAIAGAVYRTPLEPSAWLSALSGASVALKLECYQPTGSFKVRGALAAMAALRPEQRSAGVIAASAGNHGLGLAYAASRSGARATVVVATDASPAKIAALRRFPVELILEGAGYDAAERAARRRAAETGATYISAYNHPDVIAGQGTIGVELLEDMPHLDAVLVPAGGGGLISGLGAWLKAQRRAIRVIGVQAAASPALERAIRAGRLVEVPVGPSLADGLAGNVEPGSITFDLVREVVDDILLVSEEDIAGAVRAAFHETSLALEGSAVVGVAALLQQRVPALTGKQIALVITGRNIAAERLVRLLSL